MPEATSSSRACLAAVDGQTSLADILAAHCPGAAGDGAREQVCRDFEFLNAFNWMVLRGRDATPFAPIAMAGAFARPYHYTEPVALDNTGAARVRVPAG